MNAERPVQDAPRERRVCAIVVHHRNADLLDHCLRGALASVGVELDIVLYENACTEPLPAWVAGERRIHRTGSEIPLGFGEANNRAVAWAETHLAPADAYFFLNNDAVVKSDALSLLLDLFEEKPEAAAVGPLLLIWGAEGHVNSLGLNLSTFGEAWDEGIGLQLENYLPLPSRSEVLAVTGSAVLVRREAFEEVDGWSELFDFYMEDLDLCLRLRRQGMSVWIVPEAVVLHAVSATAGPSSEFKLFLFWRNRWVLMLLQWPWRHLIRSISIHTRDELRVYRARVAAGDRASADRQKRAWIGALKLIPQILGARARQGGRIEWWSLLKRAGSVPVITLPAIVERGRPWETAPSGEIER